MSIAREIRAERERKASVAAALAHFKVGLNAMPGIKPGTATKQITSAGRPMTTAKKILRHLDKVYRERPKVVVAHEPNLATGFTEAEINKYLSASTEARAHLARGGGYPELEEKLATAERSLVAGRISQAAFDAKCQKIIDLDHPTRPAFVPKWISKTGTADRAQLPDQVDLPAVPHWLRRDVPAVEVQAYDGCSCRQCSAARADQSTAA